MSRTETQKEQKTTNGSVFRSKPTNKDKPARATVKQSKTRTLRDKISDNKVPITLVGVAIAISSILVGLKLADKLPETPSWLRRH